MSAHGQGAVQMLVKAYVDKAMCEYHLSQHVKMPVAAMVRLAFYAGYRLGYRRAKANQAWRLE